MALAREGMAEVERANALNDYWRDLNEAQGGPNQTIHRLVTSAAFHAISTAAAGEGLTRVDAISRMLVAGAAGLAALRGGYVLIAKDPETGKEHPMLYPPGYSPAEDTEAADVDLQFPEAVSPESAEQVSPLPS